MADNKFTGETPVIIEGETYTLHYNMRALAELFTLEERKQDILPALECRDVETLAEIVAIGLRKHHPDVTRDQLLDRSVVISELRDAVVQALSRSRYGKDFAPEREVEDTQNDPLGKTKTR